MSVRGEGGGDSAQGSLARAAGRRNPGAGCEIQQPIVGPVRPQFAAALQANFSAITEDAESPRASSNSSASKTNGAGPRFRGVTKHKRTQRYEAHIWESKKQIYLGGFDFEVHAAKSHDIMALRCKGADCGILNFDISVYAALLPLVERLSREDVVTALRNYSKQQTAERLAAAGLSQHPGLGVRGGGVRKPSLPPRRPLPRPSRRPVAVSPRFNCPSESEEDDSECSDVEEEGSGHATAATAYTDSASVRTRRMAAAAGPDSPSHSQNRLRATPPLPLWHPTTADVIAPTVPRSSRPFGLAPPAWAEYPGSFEPLDPMVAAEYDSVDIDAVLSHFSGEEKSLTYSFSGESYLFESMPMDANHTALQHLSGAALFQQGHSNQELFPLPPTTIAQANGAPDAPQEWEICP